MKFAAFTFSIYSILASLVVASQCEEGSCIDSALEEAKSLRLKEWILSSCEGAEVNGIQFMKDETTGGGSIVAQRGFKKSELVFKLPLSCTLSSKTAVANAQFAHEVMENEVALRELQMNTYETSLALYLLEKGKLENDPYAAYMQTIPEDTWQTVPVFWEAGDLEWLQGSHTVRPERWEQIKNDYAVVSKYNEGFRDKYSLEGFAKALYMVTTRAFDLDTAAHLGMYVMVPYLDLFNHHAMSNIEWSFNNDTKYFEATTVDTIVPGEEIYSTYGRKSNSELLWLYGFSLENNTFRNGVNPDYVNITLSDPREIVEPKSFLVSRSFGLQRGGVNDALEFLRRFVVSTEAEEKHVDMFDNVFKSPQLEDVEARRIFLGVNNEVAALELFAKQLTRKLQSYKYSLQDAQELLKGDSLTERQRYALYVTVNEQLVCQFWLQTVEHFTNFFEANKGPRLMAMLRFYPRKKPEDAYRHQYATWLHKRLVTAEARREHGHTDVV